MKKTLIILSLIVAFVGLSAPVFATDNSGAYATGNLSYGATTPLSIATSKNVNLNITYSGTANPVINYVMAAYHLNGTRTFGTSNMDAKIFFFEQTGEATPSVSTATGVPPTWGTGWAPL